MEREKVKALKKFPEKDEVALVMGSLYQEALNYFNDGGFFPRVVVRDHYSDGKISDIAFENLSADSARELSQKIILKRPLAWGHVEAFANNEEQSKSWVRLFADLAYVSKRK